MERTVFISGSSIRHYDGLTRKIEEFERLGFTVLSQKSPIITARSMGASALLRNEDPRHGEDRTKGA